MTPWRMFGIMVAFWVFMALALPFVVYPIKWIGGLYISYLDWARQITMPPASRPGAGD